MDSYLLQIRLYKGSIKHINPLIKSGKNSIFNKVAERIVLENIG